MTWVWYFQPYANIHAAEFDYKSPIPVYETLWDRPLDAARGPARFRARSSDFSTLQELHCPPVDGGPPLVDDVWQRIIRKFVPDDRIQFYPTIMYAGRHHSEKYYWIIPFDRVRCIDIERSDITSMIKRPEITLIYSCDFYVHLPSCLGESHIARDEQQTGHLIVSDQLRDALAETGEASMFYRPEDVPQLSERKIH